MKFLVQLILVASALVYVSARCDNQCSGHGTCMTDDVCSCYDNFGSGLSHDSGDCSDRICPFEVAWVDHPDVEGHHHKYMECAGKGICDRSSGECQCFDGYEGKGCARSVCPNDCSGHGRCDYIQDLPYGATWNDWVDSASATTAMQTRTQSLFSDYAKSFDYHLWDKSKSRKCVCDATYGDIDCSKRLCPYGTDVLDTKDDTHYGLIEQKYQEQTILLSALEGDYDDIEGKTFALTFTSRLNETFTTIPIHLTDSTSADVTDIQNDIKLALLKLPNGVIDGVKVTVDFVDANEMYKLVSDKLFTATTFTATTAGTSVLGSIADVVGSMSTGCTIGGSTSDIQGSTTLQQMTGTATLSAAATADISETTCSVSTDGSTAGNSAITVEATTGFADNDYVTDGKGGLAPGSKITISGSVFTSSVAPVLDIDSATITKLDYTCVLNGQIIARFAMAVLQSATGVTDITVGYGGLIAGCVIKDADGLTDPSALSAGTTISAFSITGGAISTVATSSGSNKALTCSAHYLAAHTVTTTNGLVRGGSYDQSGNYIGGQDEAVLAAVNANNHRRRLAADNGLVTLKIGFTGPSVQGPQHLLVVEDYECGDGCTPRLTGMPLETRETSNYWSTVVEVTKSDFNSYECGRRGRCDYSTGLCSCFAGYVGDNCNTLTTLV